MACLNCYGAFERRRAPRDLLLAVDERRAVVLLDKAEKIGNSCVSRILRFALLAPDLVEDLVEGRAEPALMLERLEPPMPASWEEQRRAILGGDRG